MNRTELACYCLVGSALVLAGLLLARLDQPLTPTAHADMVIARNNFTLMTAQTRDDEEALFVLDNSTGRLLVYTVSFRGNRQMDLSGVFDVEQLFARAAPPPMGAEGGQAPGRRPGGRR